MEKTIKQTFNVEGMGCASCAQKIERNLNETESVAADVDFSTKQATVSYNPEIVSVDKLKEVVDQIGYQLVD